MLIGFSCLFTKQHYLVGLPAEAALGWLAYRVFAIAWGVWDGRPPAAIPGAAGRGRCGAGMDAADLNMAPRRSGGRVRCS
jgi:hypothetical protein